MVRAYQEMAFSFVYQLTQSRGVVFTKPNVFQEHLWSELTKRLLSLLFIS